MRLKYIWLKLHAQSATVRDQEEVAEQQYQAQIKSKEAALELWRPILLGDAVLDRITASQKIHQLDAEISALYAAQHSQAKRRGQAKAQGRNAQLDTVSHALARLIEAMSGWVAKLTGAIGDAALQRKKHSELGRALESFAAE
ncbi:hypothetical protein CTA1_4446 [Colletotrichum tanaceti]|uniref:Uncharacterized protein n=1 Tax=Colletotrichum tanaceti TaxID=1306861 RepID=A0A4U6XF05_9PEZI|nr:hypothetical protein CTA1_4446 [Colletotrichum tanaceti]